MPSNSRGQPPRLPALLILLILVPLPSIGLIFAMYWEGTRGTATGQAIYFLAKFLLVALPLILFCRKPRRWSILWPLSIKCLKRGISWGLVLVATISIGILGALWLGWDYSSLRLAAAQNGLASWQRYLALALYLSFINSLMEEFVWRDFIFRQWSAWFSLVPAVIFTNISFTLHHTLALLNQTSLLPALLGSVGVFSAGCFWSWLYLGKRSLWPGYLSHILADIAIFAWGGWLLFASPAFQT